MDRNELLDLIPAYALGALDDDDRAAVEAWLPTDAEARRLLAEYQALAELLPLAAPARRAPAGLHDDLRRRLAESQRQPTPAARSRRPAPRRLLPVLMGMAAALLVLLAGVLLLRPTDPGAEMYEQIMASAGARVIALRAELDPAVRGELVATADGRMAVIRMTAMPPIPPDRTFQLWLIDDRGAKSGGLFRVDDPAQAHYLILPMEKPIDEYTAFGVSLEPEGGSPMPDQPSGPLVFAVPTAP